MKKCIDEKWVQQHNDTALAKYQIFEGTIWTLRFVHDTIVPLHSTCIIWQWQIDSQIDDKINWFLGRLSQKKARWVLGPTWFQNRCRTFQKSVDPSVGVLIPRPGEGLPSLLPDSVLDLFPVGCSKTRENTEKRRFNTFLCDFKHFWKKIDIWQFWVKIGSKWPIFHKKFLHFWKF